MKIIELLNKLSNGETVNKIKIGGLFYIYNKDCYSLENLYLSEMDCTNWNSRINIKLESEVEIIEDKKYEDIEELNLKYYHDEPAISEDLAYVINQLIKNQNKIIERINNENI